MQSLERFAVETHVTDRDAPLVSAHVKHLPCTTHVLVY